MGKNITISDEAYELLSRFKLPGESFSDVIKRLINRGGKLLDLAGKRTITREQWAFINNEYEKLHLSINRPKI
jgi:predicted CopG family antitoxin